MSIQSAAPPTVTPAMAGLHHIGLTVPDVERSEQWYGEVLGLVRVMVEPHDDGGHAVVLQRPGTSFFVGLTHHPACSGDAFDERRTGLDHLSFAVAARSDLTTWADHLDQLGVRHSGVKSYDEPFPFALIVFRDPDGVQLEVTWS